MFKKLVLSAYILFLSGIAQATSYNLDMPLTQAKEFAPEVISTDAYEINTVFNRAGDSVIFARCDDAFTHCVMMESQYKNAQWQDPVKLPFSGDFHEGDAFYNADYSSLYFISQRPVPGSNQASKTFNLWKVNKTQLGWGEPEYIEQLSSDAHELYPSLGQDNSLYFVSFKDQQRHLYRAELKDGLYQTAEKFPELIYGQGAYVGDTVVSRDGKLLIASISGRSDSQGKGDLYVSRLINNQWTVAESLGTKVNSADHEFTPILSPDNKYLFFTRVVNGVGNLYQIDLSTLNISLEMSEAGQQAYRQEALQAMQDGKTLAGIPLDTDWKQAIYLLVANTMQHPAWGMGHYERNYLTTESLAKEEGIGIDKDVLFAAAFLHDMATFKPWSKSAVDHSTRAAEIVPVILKDIGFNPVKISAVQDVIMGHMFAATPVDDPLAQLFHDADTLDFLGVTGITRILSLNGKSGWASNTETAIKTLTGFSQDLPQTLISESAKRRSKNEVSDMLAFLEQFEGDSFGRKAN